MKRVCLILLVLCLMAPAAVFSESTESTGEIVTSFYPIYGIVLNLTDGIEKLNVTNLAAPDTGCLHDYQLLPGDMRVLNGANVLCINGAGMESYLDNVIAQFPSLTIIDASSGILLLDNEGQPIEAGHEEHEGHDHEAHDHEAHDHDHAHEVNAHVWLDVQNTIQMANNLAAGLKAAFGLYEAQIEANREAYVGKLEALDAELRAGLEGLPRKEMITFHEAFTYFAKAYGFDVVAVIAKEPGEALNPAELASLIELIRAHGTVPLFIEPQYPSLSANTIAAETDAPVYTLDPLVTGPMEPSQAKAYFEQGMIANMKVLQEAMGKSE